MSLAMNMLLSDAAIALNALLIGSDAHCSSVGIDSRQVTPGQLFIALKGDHFDGHNFAQQALKHGAAAVMVDHALADVSPALVVQDCYAALGQLAAHWRSQFDLPLAAITGSNGKTTVKEMLASILKLASGNAEAVLATQGNLNNHIGLPLTLLKLRAQHRYAVAEMGMNHSGEISYLSHIAKPNVAVITNAGSAHIGELGSVEAIASAKAEIFAGLSTDGMAVINADDAFAPLWKQYASTHKIISFGVENPADVTATYTMHANASQLHIITAQGEIEVYLSAPGVHNVLNALAATATAIAMDVSLANIAAGLESYVGVKGRLQSVVGINAALVIDDTYNANPASVKAAINVLSDKTGEKILVLGDMGELGSAAVALHAEIGRYAKAAGIDQLMTLGNLSLHMTDAFGLGASHYDSAAELTSSLVAKMQPTSVVLVKGSRFMAMERIVHSISNDMNHESSKTENGAAH
jgi:UDP-N-acetylmuramoyl-tripeptide--D-alanyl-D-alanine ligase